MCICVNSKWYDSCKNYYYEEKNHEVEHLTSYPDVYA